MQACLLVPASSPSPSPSWLLSLPPSLPPPCASPPPFLSPFALETPLRLPPSLAAGTPSPTGHSPVKHHLGPWQLKTHAAPDDCPGASFPFPESPASAVSQLHTLQRPAFPAHRVFWNPSHIYSSTKASRALLPSRCSASLARWEPFRCLPPRAGQACSSDSGKGPRSSPHTYPGPSAGSYGRQGRNLALISLGTRTQKANIGQNCLECLPTLTPPSGLGVSGG